MQSQFARRAEVSQNLKPADLTFSKRLQLQGAVVTSRIAKVTRAVQRFAYAGRVEAASQARVQPNPRDGRGAARSRTAYAPSTWAKTSRHRPVLDSLDCGVDWRA